MSRNILVVLISSFLVTGCLHLEFDPQEWALDPELNFSKDLILLNSINGVDSVEVFTNYQNFEVSSSDEWCSVSVNENKSSIKVIVQPNFSSNQRSALITVSISRGNKFLSKKISVVQMGGVWETIGDFNVYWSYPVSDTQKESIIELLSDMVYIVGGDFIMGNTDSDLINNTSPHDVTLSSFYIGKFEVTQQQWRAVMGTNPSISKGDRNPVYNISWSEALEFVSRLSQLTFLNVSLPTDAQWEYAALGGKMSKGYRYAGSNDYTEVSVVGEDIQQPLATGIKKSNELGIYDMSGNVAEYCSDWFELDFVDPDTTDPTGPDNGYYKSVRGGHFKDATSQYYLETVNRLRHSSNINKITPYTGFRIVVTTGEK